jgi:hypothetical protein
MGRVEVLQAPLLFPEFIIYCMTQILETNLNFCKDFVHKKLNSGPNQWPESLGDGLDTFKTSTMSYYNSTLKLASDLLRVIALSLDLEENYFDQFMDGAVATMRLLHYPSQPKGKHVYHLYFCTRSNIDIIQTPMRSLHAELVHTLTLARSPCCSKTMSTDCKFGISATAHGSM